MNAQEIPSSEWDIESSITGRDICKSKAGTGAMLTWSNLSVTVKDSTGKEKTILANIDGYAEPNSMLAIMGPSGCGKSTLLDTLAGRLASTAKQSGTVAINGRGSNLSYGRSAYVTQDDVLIGTLTVRETVHYAAMLRLPNAMTKSEKNDVVDGVLSEMGLDAAADTFIGNWHLRGISGGQRRRVAIATELVTSPKILFLDEPTSGLDAAAAFHVMSSIQRLAKNCRTVVSVIHQPSSETFDLFDRLCLLSDGHVIYFGAAGNAANFFEAAGLPVPMRRSPADHFLHVINRDFSEGGKTEANISKLVAAYDSSRISTQVKSTISDLASSPGDVYGLSNESPGFFRQTAVLTGRTFVNNLRNIGVFWMRLAMYVGLCLAIGFVYFQLGDGWKDVFSRAALLFFVVAFLTFMSIAAFPAFIEDVKVFVRERLNGYYGVGTFTVANTLASLPFILLISVVSAASLYWLAALRGGAGYFLFFVAQLFMSLTVVESLMMAIAPLVPHYLMGIAGGAGIMGLFMMVSGFFQPLQSLPGPVLRYPLSYVAYHTYAFTGFMKNEFEGTAGWGCPTPTTTSTGSNGTCSVSGTDVLAYYEIMDIGKWATFGILACMAVVYRVVFFVTLKLKEARSH